MRGAFATALLGFGASVLGAVQQKCQGDLCYSLNIPDASVKSNSGDIYIQITGPTTYSWIGVGQGTGMRGAQFFIIYANANGNNVTLSPRLSSGEVMPTYNSNAQVTLLAGSGIADGKMTANIKCSSCKSWNGGSMDFTSSSTSWIYAGYSGSALNTDSTSATIRQHQRAYGTFSFDSGAQGGSSLNPFVVAASTSGSGVTTTTGASGTTQTSAVGATISAAPSSSDSIGYTRRDKILIAHGVLAGLAFAVLMPIGAILIRVLSFPGVVALHGAFQVFTLVVYICAFGIGIWIATDQGLIGEYHPIIGIVLFCLLLIQPVLGTLHHKSYAKTQSRSFWSHGHIWLGRLLIILGIVNGGLGFLLADNTTYGPIVYAVVAAVIYLAYIAAVIYGERKKSRSAAATGAPAKYESPVMSGTTSPPGGVSGEYYGNHRA